MNKMTKTKIVPLLLGIILFCSNSLSLWGTEVETMPSIESQAAILIDAKTGNILFEKNATEKHYPASITKLMTALLAIENLKPSDVISFSQEAIYGIELGSSHIGMQIGEQITVDQALHGLLLMSANEIANGLAEKVGGSIDQFASKMNVRAQQLGAQNTHFANPHGLHDENHYTTAYDMSLIARAIYNNDYFLEIMSHPTYQIPPTNKTSEIRYLAQQHRLMNKLRDGRMYRSDVIGGKTGYTDLARHTLVTVARRDGVDLIAVVLQGEKMGVYTDTNALLDYGFNSYKYLTLYDTKDVIATLPVYSIKSGKLYQVASCQVGVASDTSMLLPHSIKQRELLTELNLPDYLELGVEVGETVGTIQYIGKGKCLAENNLILSSIEFLPSPFKVDFPNESSRAYTNYSFFLFMSIGISIFFILFVLFIMHRRKKRLYYKQFKFNKTLK